MSQFSSVAPGEINPQVHPMRHHPAVKRALRAKGKMNRRVDFRRKSSAWSGRLHVHRKDIASRIDELLSPWKSHRNEKNHQLCLAGLERGFCLQEP